MWIDATVAASFVTGKDSTVADKVGFASGTRQRSGQARQLAVGMVFGDPVVVAKARRCQGVHQLGDQQRLSGFGCVERRLGQRSSGHAHLALRKPGIRQGSVRQDDAWTASTRLTRPNRPSSRCRMSACSSSLSRNLRAWQPAWASCSRQHLAGQKTADEALAEAQTLVADEMTSAGYTK